MMMMMMIWGFPEIIVAFPGKRPGDDRLGRRLAAGPDRLGVLPRRHRRHGRGHRDGHLGVRPVRRPAAQAVREHLKPGRNCYSI